MRRIDPGVILYLMQQHGMGAAAIEDLIYRQSGLLGVSGVSSDMRALRASSEPAASEAIALFVYRVVRELGSFVAALGGIDALVFSGGIGERDAKRRAEVVKGSRSMARSSMRTGILAATFDQRRRLGRFDLGRTDGRGAANRASYGGGLVVRATIIARRAARTVPGGPEPWRSCVTGWLNTDQVGACVTLSQMGRSPFRFGLISTHR